MYQLLAWYTHQVSYLLKGIMKKREVKENRKENIFTAALQCFNENGYYKASMDMIAERAKMTKRGLYYHFKSKDELFIELFHYMNKKYYEQIPSYAMRITDPEQRLLTFVKIGKQVLRKNTDFLKFSHEFMSIGIRKPEIRKVFASYYTNQVGRVRKIIEEGIDSGKFISIDPDKMARAIVLITIGSYNIYFTLNANYDLVEQHSFNINHMLRGLEND